MERIENLKKEFGIVIFEGVEYVLRQDPYSDYRSGYVNPDIWWSASAIREDELDEDGDSLNDYRVWWKEKDDVNRELISEASDIVDFDDVHDVEKY